jgi:RNA-binding, Nab2-type zinc finger
LEGINDNLPDFADQESEQQKLSSTVG